MRFMIKLLYILPFISFAQTWVMHDNHKLLENKTYIVDSIIGNGNTLYFQCGSALKINKYVVDVKFALMRNNNGNDCPKSNHIKIAPRVYADNVRYPFKCIIINGGNIKPRLRQ